MHAEFAGVETPHARVFCVRGFSLIVRVGAHALLPALVRAWQAHLHHL
jgi:hypothetical protein